MARRLWTLIAAGGIAGLSAVRGLSDLIYREAVAVVIMAFGVAISTAAAWLYFLPGSAEQLAGYLLAPVLAVCSATPAACVWPAPLAVIAGGLVTVLFPVVYLIRSALVAGQREPERSSDPQARVLAALLVLIARNTNSGDVMWDVLKNVNDDDDLTDVIALLQDGEAERPINIENWPTWQP